jgi:hypothetical protein
MPQSFLRYLGVIAILFACVGLFEKNLIQLVNIIGSIFLWDSSWYLSCWILYQTCKKTIFYSALVSWSNYNFYYLLRYFTFYPSGEKLGYLILLGYANNYIIILTLNGQFFGIRSNKLLRKKPASTAGFLYISPLDIIM